MSLSDDFKIFNESLIPNNIVEMEATIGEIAKKLNKTYYEIDSKDEHIYKVGSVGRKTAVRGVSDLDIIFDLPDDTYKKFNSYKSNGQSALLQEVKDILKGKYPKTKMRGDGQVIVIDFNKYTVELVPGFKQSDYRFKYPDTNNGGKWKITDPLAEISESISFNRSTLNENFHNSCRMIREWKNYQGFKFGGLLIDSLVYNFYKENPSCKYIGYSKYLDLLKLLFYFLKEKDPDQDCWFALGSNQKVYNKGNGIFVNRANKAYESIISFDEEDDDINELLREIFGNKFPRSNEKEFAVSQMIRKYGTESSEEFIENYYQVNIKYRLSIDCVVSQKNFRDHRLSKMLSQKIPLFRNKKLKFFISDLDKNLSSPYEIIWKVKNRGEESYKRNEVRGQLIHGKGREISEETAFSGSHFVECYIVQDNVCVARAKIDVPISVN